ncbi:ogr/Delta-like zinc finger family protein [Providencia stuartii]
MIYCPSCGHVAHTRRAHFMDDGTKVMIAQCRNIYCSRHLKRVKAFSLTVKIPEWNTFQANRDTAIH